MDPITRVGWTAQEIATQLKRDQLQREAFEPRGGPQPAPSPSDTAQLTQVPEVDQTPARVRAAQYTERCLLEQ